MLGMVDLPDPRKVHAVPIPRVGGLGIILGALASAALWASFGSMIVTYVFGSLVLMLFGALDDSRELGHYVKFIGQFIAAITVVYVGDLWVSSMPFGYVLPAAIGKPFTVVAIVGMINAINHSDGLDGLAAGESLLSLGCIVYLAQLSANLSVLVVAVAVIGGVFGFLRFNTHPAKVFMGDAGSQFIGFTLGVLTVSLMQQQNPGFSMALPALILGLPVIDILAVFALRMYHGMNWFRATKNHVHHRLLDLGYDHYQAVVIIYSVQAFFVAAAMSLKFAPDWLILSLYLSVCVILFAALYAAERSGWRANKPNQKSELALFVSTLRSRHILDRRPMLLVHVAVPMYLLWGAFWVDNVPVDFGWTGLIIAALLLTGLVLRRSPVAAYITRVAVYGTAASLVYLVQHHSEGLPENYNLLQTVFFIVLALAIGFAVRYMRDAEFNTTPTDYLLVFLVVATAAFAQDGQRINDFAGMVAKIAILFYGCELIITRQERQWNKVLSFSASAAVGTLVLKALMW